MVAKDMLAQIQHAPLAERIQIIEVILKSLKDDIKSGISGRHRRKAFKVRKFHLGQDVRCDCKEIYTERG
ncbi:MAG: hypothetical protein D3916_06705 [Candidatus Electrothrix sp. MAN1_4]|nr:hypothetical protein [Candidatus Electrothrix sp. MAN1_4]